MIHWAVKDSVNNDPPFIYTSELLFALKIIVALSLIDLANSPLLPYCQTPDANTPSPL